jgi:hypothetical protein
MDRVLFNSYSPIRDTVAYQCGTPSVDGSCGQGSATTHSESPMWILGAIILICIAFRKMG